MPTLVNDLSPPQRSWLAETFGLTGDHDVLQSVPHHYPPGASTNEGSAIPYTQDRRYLDAAMDPYQPPRELHGTGGGDRSAIFRRASPVTGSGPESHQNSPLPWSPVGPPDGYDDPCIYDSRGYYHRGLPVFPHSSLIVGMPEGRPSNTGMPDMRPTKRVALDKPVGPAPEAGEGPASELEGKSPVFPHDGEKLTWQQSYENLLVYKQAFGDCNVPQKFKLNMKLGGWVVRTSRVDSIGTFNAYLQHSWTIFAFCCRPFLLC